MVVLQVSCRNNGESVKQSDDGIRKGVELKQRRGRPES